MQQIFVLVEQYGYLGVALLMMLFATETIMPLAGFMASTSTLQIWLLILAGSVGSTIGSLAMYGLARLAGEARLRHIILRYGKWLGLNQAKLVKSERWFDHHAGRSVFLGKILPGIRSAVSVSAGYRHMHIGWYTAYTFLATTLWATILAGGGYALGAHYDQVATLAQYISGSAAILIGVVLVYRLRYQPRSSNPAS